jgi:hypothetical protein
VNQDLASWPPSIVHPGPAVVAVLVLSIPSDLWFANIPPLVTA